MKNTAKKNMLYKVINILKKFSFYMTVFMFLLLFFTPSVSGENFAGNDREETEETEETEDTEDDEYPGETEISDVIITNSPLCDATDNGEEKERSNAGPALGENNGTMTIHTMGNVIYGDVSGDGEVAVGDVVIILRYLVDIIDNLADWQQKSADVNGDGQIDITDAILILRYIVGIIDTFPVEDNEKENTDDNTDKKDEEDTDNDYEEVIPEPKYYPDYVIQEGILYGLDYWKNRVRIGVAPDYLTDGEYQVKDDYNFWLIAEDGQKIDEKGSYYYLELVPYAIMELDYKAGPAVSAEFLEQHVKNIRPDSPFSELGEAFMAAQEDWGVNALYLMAHAALESAWGTSEIAADKKNLFGYKAYDSNPYYHAGTFRSMEESINYVTAYIRRSYLDENGSFARGATLEGMNNYYATDSMWKVKIARIMNSILPYDNYVKPERKYASGLVSVSTHLNMRSAAGVNNELTRQLDNGIELTIKGMKENSGCNWLKVEADGEFGWVCGRHVELTDTRNGTVYIRDWYRTDIMGIRESEVVVRPGPGNQYEALPADQSLFFGDKVTIHEMQSDGTNIWYRINKNDKDDGNRNDDGNHNNDDNHSNNNSNNNNNNQNKELWVRSNNIVVKW